MQTIHDFITKYGIHATWLHVDTVPLEGTNDPRFVYEVKLWADAGDYVEMRFTDSALNAATGQQPTVAGFLDALISDARWHLDYGDDIDELAADTGISKPSKAIAMQLALKEQHAKLTALLGDVALVAEALYETEPLA